MMKIPERPFLDTNILVYAFSQDMDKGEIAARCLLKKPIVNVQVLNEFVDVARRKTRTSWFDLQVSLKSVHSVCEVMPLTVEMQLFAVMLAEESRLRIYDACIIAAAEFAGCETLLSEDLNPGQRFGSVTVRNPFAER
jgi:predicted nucleic acid-binding protein